MAGEDRTTSSSLALYRALEEKPYSFGFFEALRRLECLHKDKARIGTSSRPVEDPVRFGQEPSLAFAPSTVSRFKMSESGSRPRLSVLFLGLFGPNGPLPLHLTEYARDRMRNSDDPTFTEFANIFHHRLLSLFYRAWADAEPTTDLDRSDDDRFTYAVASQIGLGIPAMRNRDAMPDFAKLFFAGRLANQTKSAEGLLAILRYYFDIQVTLTQYVGEWLNIPRQLRMLLGAAMTSCALGQTTTLGTRVWECQHKFRLTFGPLAISEYQRMLPGGASLTALIAIVRNYVGDEFNWDVQLIMKKAEVKPAVLGVFGQLGWTTWVTETTPVDDPGNLYFNPMQEII